jgi:hypothetical protein
MYVSSFRTFRPVSLKYAIVALALAGCGGQGAPQPGTEATGGTVEMGQGGTAGSVGTISGNSDASTEDACQAMQRQLRDLLRRPEFDQCSETGRVRPPSLECAVASANVRSHIANRICSIDPLRADLDEAALIIEIDKITAGLVCGPESCGGAAPRKCKVLTTSAQIWCYQGACSRLDEICACADGAHFIALANECDGTADCPDGSDEAAACR